MSDEKLPAGDLSVPEKPSFLDYVETFLPFKIPRIALPQTAQNLDKAIGRIVLAKGEATAAGLGRSRLIADARAKAQVAVIAAGTKAAVEEIKAREGGLRDRAIEAAVGEFCIEQENRERIVELAADQLRVDPPKVDAKFEIDDDWLHDFSQKAAKVSREDMQTLWARVLAGEIREPGSFSLRVLHSISLLSTREARLIHEHMDLVVSDRAIFHNDKKLSSFDALLELEAMDVIQGTNIGMTLTLTLVPDRRSYIYLGAEDALGLISSTEAKVTLNDVCTLTPFGKALALLAKRKARVGIDKMIADQLRGADRKILLIKLGKTISEGSREIVSQEEL